MRGKKERMQMTEQDYQTFIALEQKAIRGVVDQRLGTEADFFALLRVAVRLRDILHALGGQMEAERHQATDIHQ